MDITPSPRILQMMGEIPFKPWQCMAELVDNSIDALLTAKQSNPNWMKDELGMEMYPININLPNGAELDSGIGLVTVTDLGPGMTDDELQNSVRAGFTGNDPVSKLGLFGMGFNIATAKLGNVTVVKSARKEDSFRTCLKIDFDAMIEAGKFSAPRWTEEKESGEEHGTIIEISALKKNECNTMTTGSGKGYIRKQLSRIYGNIITDHNIQIRIDENLDIFPYKHCTWDAKRFVRTGTGKIHAIIEIDETLPEQNFCLTCWNWSPTGSADDEKCGWCGLQDSLIQRERRVHGWLGIQRYFDPTDYGVDLIRNGRVIERDNKDFFQWPNEVGENPLEYPIDAIHWGGRIVGEIHLDFLKVHYTKSTFEKELSNWRDTLEIVRGLGPLRPNIAKKNDFETNISPLGRLFSGYRKSHPSGKKTMVPGKESNPIQGDNSTAKSWAENEFRDGVADYQDDSKWWELVEAAEKARRRTGGRRGKECPDCGKDPCECEPGGPDECPDCRKDPCECEDGPTPPYEGELRSGLSRTYEIKPANLNGIQVTALEDTRMRTRRDLDKEPPIKVEYITAGDVKMTFHGSHPALNSYSEDVKDYILMELASQFSIRAGMGTEWSVTRCYSYLKEKYAEESKLDIQTLGPHANDIIGELKEHLSTRGLGTSREDITDAELDHLEQRVFREMAAGTDEVDRLLTNGEYIGFMPNQYLVQYFKINPSLSLDGKFFNIPFKNEGSNIREEAVDMITSALRDAIDASERSQASQAPDKLWLQRARASIALLDTKRA